MRDYGEILNSMRICLNVDRDSNCLSECFGCKYITHDHHVMDMVREAADAIEELLAVCRDIASFVIHYSDEDNVSAEVLCRKLHKIGVIEKDGAWWTLPDPPKEVRDA